MSVKQVTSLTNGATTTADMGTGLPTKKAAAPATDTLDSVDSNVPNSNGLTGTISDTLNSTFQSSLSTLTFLPSTLQSKLNDYFPPSTRSNLKSKIENFARTRPVLFSFILSQLAVSGLPLVLFIITAVTVGIFAVIAGLLIGLLGALVFIVFAVGVALFVLLPVLFVTTFFAVAIWGWGWAGWWIWKTFGSGKNKHQNGSGEGPGGAFDGLMETTGLSGVLRGGNAGSSTTAKDGKPTNGHHATDTAKITGKDDSTRKHAQETSDGIKTPKSESRSSSNSSLTNNATKPTQPRNISDNETTTNVKTADVHQSESPPEDHTNADTSKTEKPQQEPRQRNPAPKKLEYRTNSRKPSVDLTSGENGGKKLADGVSDGIASGLIK